jgi:hypothetical protein
MYIKNPSKIDMSKASLGYSQLAGRIGEHSVQENVTMVPAGGRFRGLRVPSPTARLRGLAARAV